MLMLTVYDNCNVFDLLHCRPIRREKLGEWTALSSLHKKSGFMLSEIMAYYSKSN